MNGISPAKPKPRAGGGACRRPVIAERIEGVASRGAEVDNVPLDCSGVSSLALTGASTATGVLSMIGLGDIVGIGGVGGISIAGVDFAGSVASIVLIVSFCILFLSSFKGFCDCSVTGSLGSDPRGIGGAVAPFGLQSFTEVV